MSIVTISCPSCGLSRQIPAEKVPEGTRQVTCPRCRSSFSFTKEPAAAPPPPQAPPEPAPRQAPLQAELKAPREAAAPDAPPSGPGLQSPAPPEPASRQVPLQPEPKAPGEAAAPDAAPSGPALQPPAPRPRPSASAEHTKGGPASKLPPRPPGHRPPPPPRLTEVGALFTESWEIFQRRFATLIGLFLLSVAAFVIPMGAAAALAMAAGLSLGKGAVIALAALGTLAGTWLGFRCFAAFLHAVADETLLLRDALEQGKGMVLSLIWIGLLSAFIIGGGYLLLVLPGIVFTVWFCFTQFILVSDDLRGMDALLKSREYVRGEWFNVALRLLLVWAASLLLGAIPVAGPILSLAFFPYLMIFHYLIYRDLRRMKGEVLFACAVGDKIKWPALALLGYVAVPVVLVTLLGVSIMGPLAQLASREGVTLESPAAPSGPAADSADQGLRVITFPAPQESGAPSPGAESSLGAATSPTSQSPVGAPGAQERPENIHIFIYAVNYTGTIRANGETLREMEGKPEMQYNYNLMGDKLRYGENRIEVNYAELPSHSDLLRIQIKISQNGQLLKEWELTDKGNGSASFSFQIPNS